MTSPIPWLIDKVFAPLVDQESVPLFPDTMVVGLAVNEWITGSNPPVFTVTVAFAITDTPPLLAVNV